jgi:hypothetical protein
LEINAGFGPLNQEKRYCSLSHRWVGVELQLKTTNFNELREKIPMDCLSKASRDAILVTRSLGFKYLWIDSLCIIQDLKEDWIREAAKMADVYENSACTIAAAGEATVSGEDAFIAQNPLIQNYCKVAGLWEDGLHVSPPTSGLEGTNKSPLFQHDDLLSRGWVYQERMLSRKIIFFGDREVQWSCQYGEASEEEPDGKSSDEIFGALVSEEQMNANWDTTRSYNMRNISAFNQLRQGSFDILNANGTYEHSIAWYKIISEYSGCKLSREEDRLIAMSGLAQRIQAKTGWQYLAGLWRQSLLYDMLWYRIGKANRRGESYIAPTWSWASVGEEVSTYLLRISAGQSEQAELAKYPLVDIISADTETHPLDTTCTGKVNNGNLMVRGCLKNATEFILPTKYSNPSLLSEGGPLCFMVRGRKIDVGWFSLDFISSKLEDILFIPLVSSGLTLNETAISGLALIPKANYYERIGYFELNTSYLPREWLKLGEKETIVIK